MTRAELLAKIKKCLALAKSANEHEAAAAMAKARALMDEYGVDQQEVAHADVGEETARGSRAQRPPAWETVLAATVERAIPVKLLIDENGDWCFIGLTPAPEIAAYGFTALYRQVKRARADYIAKQLRRCTLARKRARADAFCEGWASAVFRQIAAIYPKQEIDDVVRGYLAVRHADLVTITPRPAGVGGQVAFNDRARGRERGREAELHRGVSAAAAPLRIGGGA